MRLLEGKTAIVYGGSGVLGSKIARELYEQGAKTAIHCFHGWERAQKLAEELAQEEDLVFLCGHYEGIDERVLEEIVTDNVSIGDYVLTGGELPAMVMIDAISRHVPGVLNNEDSAGEDSFSNQLLEYPQYSRPEVWHDKQVPPVLLSGHHGKVDAWRREQSLLRTFQRRPELLEQADLSEQDWKFLERLRSLEDKT